MVPFPVKFPAEKCVAAYIARIIHTAVHAVLFHGDYGVPAADEDLFF